MTTDKELKKTLENQKIKDFDKVMQKLKSKGKKPFLKGTGGGFVKLKFE